MIKTDLITELNNHDLEEVSGGLDVGDYRYEEQIDFSETILESRYYFVKKTDYRVFIYGKVRKAARGRSILNMITLEFENINIDDYLVFKKKIKI